MKEAVFNVNDFSLPRWNDLPEISLYSDQLITWINKTLEPISIGDSPLTKSMVNNYVKHGLVKPPVNKQYSRVHLAKLLVVCVLKSVFSMEQIGRYVFFAVEDSTIPATYDFFAEMLEKSIDDIFNKKVPDIKKDTDKEYLNRSIILACAYKIYVEKTS